MLNLHKENSRFLFLGDLLYDYDTVLPDIRRLGESFQQAGYHTILNLEAPLRSNTPTKKWINLYQDEHIVEILKLLNVVAVNIANNHIMDWGSKGLKRLLQLLDAHGILHFGAGMTLPEALAPAIIRVGDRSIGFVGFGWREEMCIYATQSDAGVSPLQEKAMLCSLQHLRADVDTVVVNLHWGYEYELYPLPIHRQLAHRLIDNGADLIIGHHPHIIQAYEVYQGKHIYYSLGDFYFGTLRNRFESIVEEEHVKSLCRFGLGVTLDLSTNDITTMFFELQESETRLHLPNFNVDALSNIPILDYSRDYPGWRTSSRKPTLYTGLWHELIMNPVKLELSHFKDLVHKSAKPTLEKLGIYGTLRRRFKALKKRG